MPSTPSSIDSSCASAATTFPTTTSPTSWPPAGPSTHQPIVPPPRSPSTKSAPPTAPPPTPPPPALTTDEVRAATRALHDVDLAAIRRPLIDLVVRLRQAGIPISDRRA